MNPYHVSEAIGIVVSGLLFYSYTHSWFPPVHRTPKSSAPEPGPAPTSAPTPSVPPAGATGQ